MWSNLWLNCTLVLYGHDVIGRLKPSIANKWVNISEFIPPDLASINHRYEISNARPNNIPINIDMADLNQPLQFPY